MIVPTHKTNEDKMLQDLLDQQKSYWFSEQPTLRDQFAMHVISGLYASETPDFKIQSHEVSAEVAYKVADAMMKAREV